MIGWLRYAMLKGLLKKALPSGSRKQVVDGPGGPKTPLVAFKKLVISFRDSNLWLNSLTWALSTEFSDSTAKYFWVVRFTDVRIW